VASIIDDSIKPASSLVVPLQPRGAKQPLFLIHAGGGYVFFYRALASRLGPDRPVYGIRAETKADRLGRPFDRSKSTEQVASRYISEIKTIQPQGPYLLGGACFGGVLAFEMARQLRSQGEEVGPVLLFDAFVLNNVVGYATGVSPTFIPVPVAPFKQRLATHLARASQLGIWGSVKYVSRLVATNVLSEVYVASRGLQRKLKTRVRALADEIQWQIRARRAPLPLEVVQQRIMGGFLKASERLLRAYTPGVYDGRIVLFNAHDTDNAAPYWAGLAQGGMVECELAGSHLDMMEEPAVRTIATLVTQQLEPDGNGVESHDQAALVHDPTRPAGRGPVQLPRVDVAAAVQ
jgi:thioesterase domain-containing protein